MDYTVGSLADLITGSNTPNKPKVIKQKFVPLKAKKNVEDQNENIDAFISDSKNTVKQKKKKLIHSNNESALNGIKEKKKSKKRKLEETFNEVDVSDISVKKKIKKKVINDNENSELVPIKSKKRKLQETSNNLEVTETSPKKKKNKKVINNNEDSELNTKLPKDKKKSKKQKLDESNPDDFVDSDEDSSAKTIKLSQNDINAERRIKEKIKKDQRQVDPVDLSKTLFVGNVPIKTPKKKIQKFFKKYGEIEAIRIRGIPVADPKIPKKTAAIKKEFHPNRNSVLCFIRFKNPEDVIKAEEVDGTLFNGHHLRAHRCNSTEKPDESKAIFVGNLSFDAEEEELWKLFESCGPISSVRVIRDTYSGMGKGFAYVNFKESDAVQLALEMEGVKLKNRELRVSLCNVGGARKKKGLKNRVNKFGNPRAKKPFNKFNDRGNSEKDEGGKQKSFNRNYQGSQFTDKKKKHKINKGLLEKKMKIKKIAPKSVLEAA